MSELRSPPSPPSFAKQKSCGTIYHPVEQFGRAKRTEVMAGIEVDDDGLRGPRRRHALGQRRAIGNEWISPPGHDENRRGRMRSILYRVLT